MGDRATERGQSQLKESSRDFGDGAALFACSDETFASSVHAVSDYCRPFMRPLAGVLGSANAVFSRRRSLTLS
ncbi:hypothetical protein GCM10008171_33730 [Methylopila jiangsuensis]|uniref:Uncharacterized protein n=1 Tax=Methylopila jiangsuensis TaxID=586230 RepID=A0A9W6JL37_9HYPH|nr:hypothetical protein GCM10008171_33730 [Methylopila jiangsuensis]